VPACNREAPCTGFCSKLSPLWCICSTHAVLNDHNPLQHFQFNAQHLICGASTQPSLVASWHATAGLQPRNEAHPAAGSADRGLCSGAWALRPHQRATAGECARRAPNTRLAPRALAAAATHRARSLHALADPLERLGHARNARCVLSGAAVCARVWCASGGVSHYTHRAAMLRMYARHRQRRQQQQQQQQQ
jgi:hypothetical protein